MGLSNILKTNTWIKMIGKNPSVFTLLSLFVIGIPFVFLILKILQLLDALTYVLASDFFDLTLLKNFDFFFKHSITASLNILTGCGFIIAAFKMYKFREKQKLLFITSIILAMFALFSFFTMYVGVYISLSMYIWTKIANIYQVCIKLIENLFLVFEQKVHIKFLDQVKSNLSRRGFNAFIYESLEHHRNQSTNIVLTCSEDYYNIIHKILLKFASNDETARMFIYFILENKLHLENGIFYKIEDGFYWKVEKLLNGGTKTKMSAKEISLLFQEYVNDSKRINTSAKEFLNPDL